MADNYEQYSKEELLRLLRERDRKPKFGLVWERNEIEHDKSMNDDFVALDLDPGLSCGVAPFENLIIEGDNFDALRYLRMTHAGRVNCIYIDPPYNTGNRDFIYNDRFVDKDDSYRHSKWLEFMYRRLTLAKDLLADDGVIFVSIDDNEMLHLGMLMEQVFGAGNFIANIIWQKRTSPDARIELGSAHDYIFAFGMSGGKTNFNKLELTGKQSDSYKNPDNDPRGIWTSTDFTAQGFRPNQMYEITTPSGRKLSPPPGRCWANLEEGFLRLNADNRMWFGKDGNARPRVKGFLAEAKGVSSWTWWPNSEVGHNQEAKKEIIEILGADAEEIFSTPKPVRLIERILRIATKPGDLVLDFFAGSGTTAHAVMKLNAEDGGRRRYILVSSTEAEIPPNPPFTKGGVHPPIPLLQRGELLPPAHISQGESEAEGDSAKGGMESVEMGDVPPFEKGGRRGDLKNLCRDVCAERVRRVAQGYTNKKGEVVAGLGGGFAYLRTRRIPVARLFNDIQHEQVWRALQLIHGIPLTNYDTGVLMQLAGNADDRLVYVAKLSEQILEALTQQAALGGRLVVYSWQPGQIRQRVEAPNVAFERIPEFLMNRFGGRSPL